MVNKCSINSITTKAEEALPHDKWCRETGNAVTAEKKLPNCLLSQLLTDLSTAGTAGQKTDHHDKIVTNRFCRSGKARQQKIPQCGIFCCDTFTTTYGHHIQKPHSKSCRICQSWAVFKKNMFAVASATPRIFFVPSRPRLPNRRRL
ncbi:MAG: hypothetical protein A3D44_01605 [Candidatus Staskawiczbacteria bacterium RIFCSPHIGHO2_02_FULL_42_22]|uniref:Uncharacterized protein n=1 Tax=Candidatus Staskawiczbacteria bacterium RIFCSPHIGHO2_02_FULL_42_22 TaxID=1802207 RepID=A0A1G2HZP2_9BACT|nr:MAG: hypothetical protein A3D44_01605 [Candidatus Staskawiczbacteria bacterium RIFCSPHIGHO2_02_FULL_42_22]